MPELVIAVVRLGFLALLWLFVIFAVRVVRTDLFGPRSSSAPAPPRPAPASARTTRAAKRSAARRLVVTQGTLAGTTVSLGDAPVTIGRADESTLVITDDYASSHHARLVPRDGRWLVEDLGSTNGTYLDRTKVSGPTPVPLGTPIRIGKTVLELRR